jgi:hypothetical protein
MERIIEMDLTKPQVRLKMNLDDKYDEERQR